MHALDLPTTSVRRAFRVERAAIPGIGLLILALGMATSAVLSPEYSRYDGNSEPAFPLYLLLVLFGWLLAAR